MTRLITQLFIILRIQLDILVLRSYAHAETCNTVSTLINTCCVRRSIIGVYTDQCFSNWVSRNHSVPRKGWQEFRETKMFKSGTVLLAVLNLYVRVKIRVATLGSNHSVTDCTQTIATSVQKFPDSVVQSVSTARHGQSMCQEK